RTRRPRKAAGATSSPARLTEKRPSNPISTVNVPSTPPHRAKVAAEMYACAVRSAIAARRRSPPLAGNEAAMKRQGPLRRVRDQAGLRGSLGTKGGRMGRQDVHKEMEEMFGTVISFVDQIPDAFIDAEWDLMKRVQFGQTLIPNKYKELMGLAISAV